MGCRVVIGIVLLSRGAGLASRKGVEGPELGGDAAVSWVTADKLLDLSAMLGVDVARQLMLTPESIGDFVAILAVKLFMRLLFGLAALLGSAPPMSRSRQLLGWRLGHGGNRGRLCLQNPDCSLPGPVCQRRGRLAAASRVSSFHESGPGSGGTDESGSEGRGHQHLMFQGWVWQCGGIREATAHCQKIFGHVECVGAV